MARKSEVKHASKGKKGNLPRPPKRAAMSLAQDAIKEDATGRRKRKRAQAAGSSNKENNAPVPAPMPTLTYNAMHTIPVGTVKPKVRKVSAITCLSNTY